jgi:hypothetical protein
MQFKELLRESFLRVEQEVKADALLPIMRENPTSCQYVDARVNEIYELIFSEEREKMYTALNDENMRLQGLIQSLRRDHEAELAALQTRLKELTLFEHEMRPRSAKQRKHESEGSQQDHSSLINNILD